MLIKLIRYLIGTLSPEDKETLYTILGVVVKAGVEGALKK